MDLSWGPLPLVGFYEAGGRTPATSMVGCFRSWEKKKQNGPQKNIDFFWVAFLRGGFHNFLDVVSSHTGFFSCE